MNKKITGVTVDVICRFDENNREEVNDIFTEAEKTGNIKIKGEIRFNLFGIDRADLQIIPKFIS